MPNLEKQSKHRGGKDHKMQYRESRTSRKTSKLQIRQTNIVVDCFGRLQQGIERQDPIVKLKEKAEAGTVLTSF